MATRKSSALLPEIYRSSKNRKFLNATLDQLVSEDTPTRINSYVGRTNSANYVVGDGYLQESSSVRQNFQLEPGVVYKNTAGKIESVHLYPETLNAVDYYGGNSTKTTDLFAQDYYNWSGFIDYDKLVNYGEYFWLPAGPDSVQVFSSSIDTEKSYKVLRESVEYERYPWDTTNYDNYVFDGVQTEIKVGEPYYRFDSSTSNPNPTIYLARGGEYTFEVEQEGASFWIQTERGTSGVSTTQNNISTREVAGVINNGAQVGTITFRPPEIDSQNRQVELVQQHLVDFATDFTYKELHNVTLENFLATNPTGIDGVTQIDGKTIVFASTDPDASEWEQGSLWDAAGYDGPENFDATSTLTFDERYGVFVLKVMSISGTDTITLTRTADIDRGKKVGVKSGVTYGNRELERTAQGFLELIPPITANQETLYYQDGTDANRFGKIILVNSDENAKIDVTNDILFKTSYTSPNGVEFINGLKIEFNNDVIPSSYEGEWYVEGVGSSIQLVKVSDLATPEPYSETLNIGYDSESYDSTDLEESRNAPTKQDYILINRASPDLNAWSRYNRWFHRRVIEATNTYNGFITVIEEAARAKRPIIEFDAGLELFNYGTNGKRYVDVVDVTETDALSNVNGKVGYYSENFALTPGVTVIFTKDPDTRQNVYQVKKVDEDNDAATDKIIVLERIDTIAAGDVVVSNYGTNTQGNAYWYKDDTTGWQEAQQKTKINQDPLFQVQDATHTSFSDSTKYPSSTFVGSKLFSYKRATTGSADAVLGFALSYKNFGTIGDIVFENNFIKDKFQYTKAATGATNVIVKSGHTHKWAKPQTGTELNRTMHNGWRKILRPSEQWQIVQYDVDTELFSFEIGSARTEVAGFNTLKVYVNNAYYTSDKYTESTIDNKYYVNFTTALEKGDVVTIKVISSTVNPLGYYEVPLNLENNANNTDFTELTVGQVRNHIKELATNIPELAGPSLGSNNIRDIDYKKYPGTILQHSAGNILPQYLLTNKDVDFESAMRYSMEEYTRFKKKFLDNLNELDLDLRSPKDAVDSVIDFMVGTKSDTFPFYYTDMIAWGSQKSTVYHTVDDVEQKEFDHNTEYKATTISNQAVLVYIKRNNTYTLLVQGRDYTHSTTKVAIVLDKNYTTVVGDQLEIVEYTNTNGSFVPPTPTKLGLWPKWYPQKYTDKSYTTDQTVVQGHDGSIWVGYGDIRDDIVLELEKRIYNNIKTNYSRDLFDWHKIIPGYYRHTEQYRKDFVTIYRKYFASWAFKNRLNYASNTTYNADDSFSWNYRQTTFHGQPTWQLPGYWRGTYRWLYDTDTPHTTPWEMFGHELKPSWWEQRYGPAPYTAGNSVLWEDLRDGKVYADATSTTATVNDQIKRPDILDDIPVDEQGNLVSPLSNLTNVSSGDSAVLADWIIGDVGPVENAWMRSSEWPFACQLAGALIKPSQYFTLMFDTNLFAYDSDFDQILQKDRTYRPSVSDYNVNGVTVSNVVNRIEGYNQFFENYMTGYGKSKSDLQTRIQNLTQNLTYKVAGFTDKKQLKVIIEVATPSSGNQNIFLPDENITVHLQESMPLDRVFYSGVNIIKREVGYEIKGFDVDDPVFRIIPSQRSTNTRTITVGGTNFTLYDDFKNEIALVPYNTVFTSVNQVADFLNAYNRYLNYKGITFDGQNTNGKLLDFNSAISELGIWIEQDWDPGTVLSISPALQQLTVDRPLTTIGDLSNGINLRNNNSKPIKVKDVNVERIDTKTTVFVNNENEYLYSARLDPVQFEHVLVFDNTTIFNDIIYQPELGNRQDRLKLVGSKSGGWNGTLHAPGSTLNQESINVWRTQQDYKRADVVSHRDKVYVAKTDHIGTVQFADENWLVVENMQTGLIPNSASRAKSFQNFYDVDSVNLESEADRAGKGQIGFRNREYLENLGLDDTSQVKFYQGMLKNKGTTEALDKLIKANLTNLQQEINVFEEWGFRVGEYGSIGSNQVLELQIDEADAQRNPFNVQLIDNEESLSTDVIGVKEKQIYKKPDSYNKNLFIDRGTGIHKNDLVSAGFPRLDDVDFTVFSIDDIEAELTTQIDKLGRADKIWVADRSSTWDVLRVSETAVNIIAVQQNVEPQVTFKTDGNHGLVKNDFIIIKGSEIVQGCYKITSVQSPTEFTVIKSDTVIDAETNLLLPLYKLESVRYATPNLISTTNPLYGWSANEKIWVDTTSTGKWGVYNKTNPYDSSVQISAAQLAASDQQGASLDVSSDGLTFVAGSPGGTSVVNYSRDENGIFNETSEQVVTSISSTLGGFGNSVAYGKQWVAVGAPTTDSSRGAVFIYNRKTNGDIELKQGIVPAIGAQGDEYGYSLAISNDDRFLFVGSPGSDEVYCYHLYTQATDDVKTITGNASDTTFALGFTPGGGDELTVTDINGKVYLNVIDFTVSGSNITFTGVPANSLVIIARRTSHFKYLQRITGTSSSRFGHSVAVDKLGQTLVVGAPHDSSSVNKAGSISIYHQEIERFIGNGTQVAFTTTGTIPTNMEFVEVNGTTLIPATGADGGTDTDSSANRFARSSNTITTRFIPATGDIIEIYIGQWQKVQDSTQGETVGSLSGETASDSELFGWSVSIDSYGTLIAVGAPGEDSLNINTGSVYILADEARRFGTITTKATYFNTTSGSSFFINNREINFTTTNNPSQLKTIIDAASISEVSTSVSGEYLTISSTNKSLNNKLSVRPGSGSDYESTSKLGLEPFRMIQKIDHPNGRDNENFGLAAKFDRYVPTSNNAEQTLVIASDKATTLLPTRFDVVATVETTTFDAGSTQFIENVNESGAAYVYALLEPAGVATVTNSPLYAFGQQLQSTTIDQFDSFGCALGVYDNKVYVGSKNDDQFKTNGGSTYEFTNSKRNKVWSLLRSEDSKVDIDSINRVITYDKRSQQVISFLDTVDIAKGKIPGRAQSELDFVTEYDPAVYSVGDNTVYQINPANNWNNEYIGKTWWDITQCRALDYEQGELEYRRNNWNQFFPGSQIVVCEWVESLVLPSEYVDNGGEGVPLYADDTAYSESLQYNSVTNSTQTRYYYWVTGKTSYPNNEVRTMSTSSVEAQISDPVAAGIKFMSLISKNAMMFNNIKTDLSDKNTIVAINYDRVINEGILHSEFDLVAEGDPEQAIPMRIWTKLIDSMAGADLQANIVPDPNLSVGEKYGIQIRPRQTMFVNKQEAAKVMVNFVNKEFAKIPIVRNKTITGFTVSDPIPTKNSGEWNQKVADITTRDYLNTEILSTGYLILIENDSNFDNQWTIYKLEGTGDQKYWSLHKIQGYDTSRYWEYTTWYETGYTAQTIPNYQVDTEPELLTLTQATEGQIAKVLINDDGNFSFFCKKDSGWDEVIIENGTIKLLDSLWDYSSTAYGSYIGWDNANYDFGQFDRVPQVEIRQILNTIKNDIFINEQRLLFNTLFFRLIEYSLHEQNFGVDWVFKSSFIKTTHKQRNLIQYPTYKNDNSQFVEQFINEVKPYHTKIREYITEYDGDDQFQGDVTDFDVHSFYDEELGYFRKPSGDFEGDNLKWPTGLNKPFNDNRSYYLDEVEIHAAGTGYVTNPTVTVSAPDITGGVTATVQVVTNGSTIIRATVTNKGSGYTKTPTITIESNTAGTGLVLLPRIKNDTVRELDTTLKFDRITYSSTVKTWAASTTYSQNDLVMYQNPDTLVQEVYYVVPSGGTTTGTTFSTEDTTGAEVFAVYADETLASAADRIESYYVPSSGMIGDDLALLQEGTDYTGTRVSGVGFDREPGWDSSNYDVIGWDDFEVDTDGLTVLSGASAFDTQISSTFTDLALGTRPEDINIDGGAFVDEYNSHAPEEVVPGRVFDTLDMEVYTDPSDDYEGDGNSVQITFRAFIGDGSTKKYEYASSSQADQVTMIVAYIGTTPTTDFTINYETRELTFGTAPAANSNVYLYGYGSTGEKITHEETIIADGSTLAYALAIEFDRVKQMRITVDGQEIDSANFALSQVEGRTIVTFTSLVPSNGSELYFLASAEPAGRDPFTTPVRRSYTLDGTNRTISLGDTVQYGRPLEGNIVVELNGVRLQPSNAKHYTLDGSTVLYAAPTSKGETLTNTTAGQVGVTHIDKSTNTTNNLSVFQDYTVSTTNTAFDITADSDTTKADSTTASADFDGSGDDFRAVTLNSAYSQGDSLIVYYQNGEYTTDGTSISISEDVAISNGDTLLVTIFSNHDPLRIQTQVFKGLGSDIVLDTFVYDESGVPYDSSSYDGESSTGLSSKKYTIDRTLTETSNLNYLWVTVNGVKLHPGEYKITDGKLDLTDYTAVVFDENTIIAVTSISENIIQPTTGFRVFYNMLGETEYFRLCANSTTELAQKLNPTDTKVYVKDASVLSSVTPASQYPGVLFVGNERITYWEIDTTNNYVSNIRRGTGGTRFADVHRPGTTIVDNSEAERLPQTNTHTNTWYDAGSTTAANGQGLQQSSGVNAQFLKDCEAIIPNYLVEFSADAYVADNYVETGYIEEQQ